MSLSVSECVCCGNLVNEEWVQNKGGADPCNTPTVNEIKKEADMANE